MCGLMNDTRRPLPPSAVDPRLRALRQQLDAVSSRDFGRLLGRWRTLLHRPDDTKLVALGDDIERSAAKRRARADAKPAVTLDADAADQRARPRTSSS